MRVLDNKPSLEDALIHYGIKGMKWGVRKQESSSETTGGSDQTKRLSLKDPRVKRAAIAGVAIAGIIAAAYIASKHDVKTSSFSSSTVKSGAETATKILERPTDMIYLSKPYKGSGVTRNGIESTTLRFISTGQTKDYFTIFDNAGLNSDGFKPGDFKKLSNGDVAALFSDLSGRVDDAGRSVPHAVFIPADKAVGLNSVEDVIQKYGPELERRYLENIIQSRRDST